MSRSPDTAARPEEAVGLLLVDKPEGPTSHDVVSGVRRALGVSRAGHSGTLDPFASGLLVIALGAGTRLLRFLSGSEKTYEGSIRLGRFTDTDDRTGTPLPGGSEPVFGPEDLAGAVQALTGEYEQISPTFSARKHQGVPFHRLARRGRTVPRRPATVRVRWDACARVAPDLLRIRVTVSAGTYIRALARDLGAALGCGGHLEALRRTAAGPFEVAEAVAFPAGADTILAAIRPLEDIPLGFPAVPIPPEACRLLLSGRALCVPEGSVCRPAQWVRLLGAGGRLLALAEVVEGRLQPRIVLPAAGREAAEERMDQEAGARNWGAE